MIAVTPALRERAYAKTAAFVDAVADALVKRGTTPSTARLTANVAMAAFEHANRRWASDPTIDLAVAIAEAGDEVLTICGG